jgi:hypothetical protein
MEGGALECRVLMGVEEKVGALMSCEHIRVTISSTKSFFHECNMTGNSFIICFAVILDGGVFPSVVEEFPLFMVLTVAAFDVSESAETLSKKAALLLLVWEGESTESGTRVASRFIETFIELFFDALFDLVAVVTVSCELPVPDSWEDVVFFFAFVGEDGVFDSLISCSCDFQ